LFTQIHTTRQDPVVTVGVAAPPSSSPGFRERIELEREGEDDTHRWGATADAGGGGGEATADARVAAARREATRGKRREGRGKRHGTSGIDLLGNWIKEVFDYRVSITDYI
jgi:hypothetical protein